MKIIDINNKKETNLIKRKRRSMWIVFALVLLSIFVMLFIGGGFATPLNNDVEVKKNSELIYYLNVSYDGVDKDGVESGATTVSEIKSGKMFIEDKIPEGLEFTGFVTTADGSIGAVKRSDGTTCPGIVIDDTHEVSTTEGVWNNGHTEYTYHGLHYDATTRTVTFQVKNLKAGCQLTVGIKTKTPTTIDDPITPERETRRDFYNFATARERGLTINSNTAHAFMGNPSATLYNVTYQYISKGIVPTGAPTVPQVSSYPKGAKVGVAPSVEVEGYTFSGWTTTDATISNNSFVMPEGNVVLKGSFTQNATKKVTYTLTGTTPSGYVLPSEKNYYPGAIVTLDSLEAGDVFNGYRFLGWTTTDVTISSDRDFTMPSSNVVLVGEFEEVTYKVTYQFYSGVLPPNAENYLPAERTYRPGVTVTTASVLSEPTGYKFLGWYKEDEFEMPEHDVVIYGEWKVFAGSFEPTITKEIVNTKNYYRIGDVIRFRITITNTAAYSINNVIVKENNDNSYFEEGTGYTILSDHVVNIATLAANSSIDLYATYTVSVNDSGTIINEAEIKGALADNGYELAAGEYTSSANFKIQSQLEICKTVTGSYNENTFQFHVTGTTNQYDTWISLEDDECETIFIDPSTYKIKEVIPQEYTITSVSGAISSDGSTLTVAEGQNYTITYTNQFTKKVYFHSFGRAMNKIGITQGRAYFLPGPQVNVKMKQLAGDDTSTNNETTTDTNVTAILHSNTEPSASNKQAANIVSKPDSPKPIYMWYDNGTIYWWSEDNHPLMNEDSSYMFNRFSNLVNINGLEDLDSSIVTTMQGTFRNNFSITNYNALENWNTSNVRNMSATFGSNIAITTLDGLEDWDVSRVNNMAGLFYSTSSIGAMALEDISALKNWNVSNVENMNTVFQKCENLTSLDGLEDWNTSKVTNMSSLFNVNKSLTDISALKDWDVSKVTNMSGMFAACSSLEDLDDLADWDVSSVANFQHAFELQSSLVDASGINDWNINRNANFNFMFQDDADHPTFTEVEGTWNSSGTFIPGAEKVATFLTGTEVNIKMKQLAGDDTSTDNENTVNTSVTAILRSTTEPSTSNKQAANTVSTADSPYPIYMWYDNGTIYWWSEDNRPNMNSSSAYMFQYFSNLTNISGLERFDSSAVTSLRSEFANDSSLADLTPIKNWNTSAVTSLRQIFLYCISLKNITPLKDWDVSNVTSMFGMFQGSASSPMIIEDLTPLRNWNVSKVTTMQAMLLECDHIESLDGLEKWQTLALKNIHNFVKGDGALNDISAIRKWNVSKVTTIESAFRSCSSLTDLDELKEWNVKAVTTFTYAFSYLSSLTDASGIKDWDIDSTDTFSYMFRQSSTHPTFTKVTGTWNSSGTFIPSS